MDKYRLDDHISMLICSFRASDNFLLKIIMAYSILCCL
ncbi:hypothetical protein M090_2085 [Parabacteroides distasonis str. 3776 Po2 i]|nr:hypothetical protein M090_2085 [Parabacteroides distasonis str. 3776 Po2 i]KDS65839.1 hypothetical protein M096_4485 [Parabacteroides distasonis str. 3999B T(B) 6]KDS70132.1 hypothetical protein M095_1566 [Parabacteroides distasonis str. 3999B T(B) 4]